MKLIKWAWAFIPDPAKIWVAVIGCALILVTIAGIVYKIDKGGYDRCEGKYSSAALELKDSARKEILELEKKYDKIKSEIVNVKGENAVCGPRVELAIDRMPGASGSE